MKRRDLIKQSALAGAFLPFTSTAAIIEQMEATGSSPLHIGPNIYQSIGVEPIINCRGTFTIIGGSIERPEVVEAMHAASGSFVQYDELAYAVGKRLAEISGAEWGLVSSGCAAGLKHVTAAAVTGGNPEILIRIPDLTGIEKNEVIIPAHSRNTYDHAIRNIGVRIITVSTPEELSKAISKKTALIYLMTNDESNTGQPLSLEVLVQTAKPFNVPVLIDAAAEMLSMPNIYLQRGASVVAYSGGKAICGPQCAGLLLGKKDLLLSAWQASSPHHGPGRDDKVGKEEILGMLAAVEAWTKRDHAAEWKTWLSYLNTISTQVTKIAGVTTSIFEPTDLDNKSPVLSVSWDPARFHVTADEAAEDFARVKPRIAIGAVSENGKTTLQITAGQMQPGNDKIVAERIFNFLSIKRNPKPTTVTPPAINLHGQWEMTVEFFSGRSVHHLFLEQDGQWIQGIHQTDFNSLEIMGQVEGNQFKLKSNLRLIADGITYLFAGTLTDNQLTGSIYMGEYQTAKFKATRVNYKMAKRPIVIPGGPPLAT